MATWTTGSLPVDSGATFMMIEDLYKSVEKMVKQTYEYGFKQS